MGTILTDSQHYSDIADAIRAKSGTTETYKPAEMPAAIEAIPSGGGDDALLKTLLEAGRDITLFELPSGLTVIGTQMFQDFTKLDVASLPVGLTAIKTRGFQGCSSLTLDSLPAGLTVLERNAFYNCAKVTIGSLPYGVTAVNDYAFYGCGMDEFELHPGVTMLSNYAFGSCSKLARITFKGTISDKLMANAFSGCAALTEIRVPWSEGAVSGAPWGATNATIVYDYNGG